jgi:hypothetical protein
MAGIYAEKKEGGNFSQVDPGMYPARCYSMIEIGTIETEFNGEKKKAHKVNITWELPTELAVFKDGERPMPYVVSKTYTLSMHEKSTLRRDLESWRGKGYTEEEAKRFDITKLLGQPCNLNIIHEAGKEPGKTYVRVASITPLMKGQSCPDQINLTRVLCFEEFNWDVFETLSDWMKEKIKSSEQYKKMVEPQAIHTEAQSQTKDDDDLPF